MRIIAGSFKGRNIKTLAGNHTRPTTGKVRAAVFSSLQALIPGSVWLDLFAGSGGVGIEALSRGADFCWFVERKKPAWEIIKANINELGVQPRSRLLLCDAAAACGIIAAEAGKVIDIAYLDPPYADTEGYVKAITSLQAALAPGGYIIIEHSPDYLPSVPYGQRIRTRKYGSSALSIFQEGKGE